MLDPVLTAYERAGLEALAGLPLVKPDAITRRALGYLPAKTGYYAVDLAILPAEGRGHPVGEMEVDVDVTLRVVGRGTDSAAVLDRVRFLADLSLERLCAAAALRPLLGDVGGVTWQRELEIADGPVVVVESAELRATLRHTAGVGPLAGIVRSASATMPGGELHAQLDTPRIYEAGLDMVHIAPAEIAGLFAGLRGDGSERLALRRADGVTIGGAAITSPAGAHTFGDVPAGDYHLVVLEQGSDAELARSPRIRVRETP